jgi:hypothetical protein
MRTLRFENDDVSKKRFEVVFHGLMVLGNQNTQKGLSILNREISILDKLEAISAPCKCGKKLPGMEETDRELIFNENSSCEFTIDDHEFDLLYDYISKVPWSIGESSRNAIRTLNWLKNGSPTSN